MSYDEFLSQDELFCLVEGCDWEGQHLMVHVNQAHGIDKDTFKDMLGFNKHTGLVGKALSIKLRERELVGFASNPECSYANLHPGGATKGNSNRKVSAEAKEHLKKSRKLALEDYEGDKTSCLGCNKEFNQPSPFGRKKYCSDDCREDHYTRVREENSEGKIPLRREDGTFKEWVVPEDK